MRVLLFLFCLLPFATKAADTTGVKRFSFGGVVNASFFKGDNNDERNTKTDIRGMDFGVNMLYRPVQRIGIETGIHYRQFGYNTSFYVSSYTGGFGSSSVQYSWTKGHVIVRAMDIPLKLNYILTGRTPFCLGGGGSILLRPLITFHSQNQYNSDPRSASSSDIGYSFSGGGGLFLENDVSIFKVGLSAGVLVLDNKEPGSTATTYKPADGISFARSFASFGITVYFKSGKK